MRIYIYKLQDLVLNNFVVVEAASPLLSLITLTKYRVDRLVGPLACGNSG